MNGTTLLGTLLCAACALGGAAATFTGARFHFGTTVNVAPPPSDAVRPPSPPTRAVFPSSAASTARKSAAHVFPHPATSRRVVAASRRAGRRAPEMVN